MAVRDFHGPKIVSEGIIRHTSGNKGVYILDVAAGTGRVAEEVTAVCLYNQAQLNIIGERMAECGSWRKIIDVFFKITPYYNGRGFKFLPLCVTLE